MSRVIFLDSGPLGMVTNPKTSSTEVQECKVWLNSLMRRTEVMLLAAQLWADARKRGKPTAEANALDGDVILAAQAILEANQGHEVIIATTNVGHLSQFIDAREWRLIE